MKLTFSERGWDDYLYWQQQDRKILERINHLFVILDVTPLPGLESPSL